MRVDRALWLGLAVAAALAGARPCAGEEPSRVADPTAVTRVVEPTLAKAPDAAPPDPCESDRRCRVGRFRDMLARQRRAEYILRVEAAARAMEDRLWDERPYRLRYPWSVELMVVSNLALPGAMVGFAPIWFFRMEAWIGRYAHGNYYSDITSGASGNVNLSGFSLGSEGRFTPLRFPLSPYVSLGWGYVGSTLNYFSYSEEGGSINSQATAHLITAGIGLDLLVPYFHLSVGYQLAHAFYVQSSINSMHDPDSKPMVRNVMDDNHHGISFTIGCSF